MGNLPFKMRFGIRRHIKLIPSNPWLKNVPHLLISTLNAHTFSAEVEKRGAPGLCGLHICMCVSECKCVRVGLYLLLLCVRVCICEQQCGGQCNTLNQCGRCEDRGSAAVKMNKEENCFCFVFTSCEIAINYACCQPFCFLLFAYKCMNCQMRLFTDNKNHTCMNMH